MSIREAVGKDSFFRSVFDRLLRFDAVTIGFVEAADTLRRRGELEAAAKLCAQGLRQFPDYASGHVVRGEVLRDQGQLDLAEQAWRQALRLHAEHPRAHLRLAQFYLGRGEISRALAELEFALLYSRNAPEAAALLSTTKENQAQGNTALPYLKGLLEALKCHPAVSLASLVEATGKATVREIGSRAAELATALLIKSQLLMGHLQVGRLLSVTITGSAGEVQGFAETGGALLAVVKADAEGRDLTSFVSALRKESHEEQYGL